MDWTRLNGKRLPLFLLTTFVIHTAQGAVVKSDLCSDLECKPGRECLKLENGLSECVCMTKCPDHWKPICGSDGVSYDNHCELHRRACIDGRHISPTHQGFCKKDRQELLARQEFIEELSHWGEERKVPLPVACFENDRNRLREFLISWFQLSANKQKWFSPGMSYGEIISGHFTAMDKDGDNYLDSQEMFVYISRKDSNAVNGTKSDKIRQLCLDALVEEGDMNMDWRLGYEEYKELLKEDYISSIQVCKMNGKVYSDGAETIVECNGCVCACGKWVCTSNKCTQGYKDVFKNQQPKRKGHSGGATASEHQTSDSLLSRDKGFGMDKVKYHSNRVDDLYDEDDYSDESDDEYDYKYDYKYDYDDEDDSEEDPEYDPDVADINWF